MKVVIQTQYRENYGSAEKPHWKSKGGHTYVVANLTEVQAKRAVETGSPTLTALVGYMNPMSEEHVMSITAEDDARVVCDPWETITFLSWENGRWVARETVVNGEYHFLNRAIAKIERQWDMAMAGGRENFTQQVTLADGRVVSYEEALKELV